MMKKIFLLLLTACLAMGLAACGSPAEQGQTPSGGQEQGSGSGQESSGSQGGNTQLVNPLVAVDGPSDFQILGIYLAAPEDATDVSYGILSDEIAQVSFVSANEEYLFRGSRTVACEDMHGIYDGFDADELNLAIDGDAWSTIIRVRTVAGGAGGTLASWSLDEANYTLWCGGSADSETVGDLASSLAEQMYIGSLN